MCLKTFVVWCVSEPLNTTTLPSTVQILIYDVAETKWRAHCSEQGGKSVQSLPSKHELHRFTIASSPSDRCAFFGSYQAAELLLPYCKIFQHRRLKIVV